MERLSDEDLRRVLAWGKAETVAVPWTTLSGLVEAVARDRWNAVAVVSGETRWTYGDLDLAADGLAGALRSAGVRAGSAVGVSVSRGPDLIAALLAVLKAGAWYVPLDPVLPSGRLSAMLKDSGPVACIVDDPAGDGLPAGPWRQIGCRERTVHSGPGAAPTDLAYVIYTSGSTGRPKGVCVEHRSAVDLAVNSAAAYGLEPTDRLLAYASVGFDISVAEIFSTLAAGATLVIADEDDRMSPDRLQELLVRERVTVAEVPPALLALLDPAALPAIRLMIVGGEAPSPRQVDRWLTAGPRVINCYGPTETTVTATMMECRRGPQDTVPIGRPMPNHTAYVLDDTRELVPPGEPGELWIGGTGVARGYLGLPELTGERFVADPFCGGRMYRTGDRVRWNEDGTLDFLGRVDGQLNLRGYRIEPGDVEATLRACPGVRDAAVAVRDIGGEPHLVGYLVADGPTADVAGWCSTELPPAFIPTMFVTLDRLPLTSTGKVDRSALPVPTVDRAAGRSPRTAIEERLLALWRDVFGTASVGVDNDFFGLGGQSLTLMRLLARVRRTFGVELLPGDLHQTRTVAAMAKRIESTEPVDTARELAPGPSLSYYQRQLWFVDRLNPGQAAYNLPVAFRLRGPVDPAELRRALGVVAQAHEILRTSFAAENDQPVARVAPAGPVDLIVTDLSGWSKADRERRLSGLVREDADEPFALDTPPLWRARLVRLGDDEWVLILVAHHAIVDGWSISLWLRAVVEAYAGTDPQVEAQYRDFAAWEARRLAVADPEYWRHALRGAPRALDLPTDRARPSVQTHTPGVVRARMPGHLVERVTALSARHRVTPYVVLLSLFQTLMGRLAGTEDLVVASPVAVRPEPEFESLIGLLVNTVPVRADLSGDPTVGELLARTGSAVLDVAGHADIPFSLIVAAVAPPRDPARAPLAQVSFNLLNYPPERFDLPGVTAEALTVDPPGSLLDLTLYVREDGAQVTVEVVYNRDLFDEARMRALLDQYLYLVDQADDHVRLADLSLAPRSARLPDPDRPRSAATGPTVVRRFRARARWSPDRIAVEGHGGSWTYGELDAASDRLAAWLPSGGSTVAISATRSTGLAAALLGVFKAGGVGALVDPSHPAPRQVAMLDAVRPDVWLAVDERPPPPAVAARLGSRRISLPDVLGSPTGAMPAEPCLDDPAYILFTSGSTGVPAAVVATHHPLAHFLDWYPGTFGLGAADRFAVASGTAHDPILRDLIVPLCLGATAVVPPPDTHRAPDALARWLREENITVWHTTPQLGRLVAQAAGSDPLPDLRLLVVGGDRLSTADAQLLIALCPQATVVSAYGATETPQIVAWQDIREEPKRPAVPLGRAAPGAKVLVVTVTGAPAGVGELGEIVVAGPFLSAGYRNDPGRTRARFRGDRYYTGDLGRYLPDGRVEFAGRRDGQLKIRGHRVEAGEVASTVEQHDQVRQAYVTAFPDHDGEPRLVAFVVPESGVRPDLDDIRRHLAALLPAYTVPAAVVPMDRIPLTTNGKVDMAALPQWTVRRPGGRHRPPRGRAEQAVARLWRDVLGCGPVGLDDNFFDLGGTSLHLVEVCRRLAAALAVDVAVLDLFQYPTVRTLAARLTNEAEPGAELAGAGRTPAPRAVRRIDLRRARTARHSVRQTTEEQV